MEIKPVTDSPEPEYPTQADQVAVVSRSSSGGLAKAIATGALAVMVASGLAQGTKTPPKPMLAGVPRPPDVEKATQTQVTTTSRGKSLPGVKTDLSTSASVDRMPMPPGLPAPGAVAPDSGKSVKKSSGALRKPSSRE